MLLISLNCICLVLSNHTSVILKNPPGSHLFAAKRTETEWRRQIQCFSRVMGSEWDWHLGPWLWMIMWQVAKRLSHWDQLSQVSGAIRTLEASLVDQPQTHPFPPPPPPPHHTPPPTPPPPPYRPRLSDRINPQSPHTWVITLSDSSLEIPLSFSSIVLSVEHHKWLYHQSFFRL